MSDWDAFRRLMPVTQKWAYFDHAAVAPVTEPARAAMTAWADEAASEGDTRWPEWNRRVEKVRSVAAEFVNAAPDEIALVPNTTGGIGLVAEGFPWQPGDNVVIPADEFPSNAYPWMNLESRGVETRRVATEGGRVDLDRLAAACDARTRIVSVSWVGYASGWRIDVNQAVEMAHSRGALLFLDAIQGLGVFPLDVDSTKVDFFAADGHKWLLGPEGAGLLYIRHGHLDRLRPLGVGWHSVEHSHDYGRVELNFKNSAARYEGGSQNMVGFLGLGASLDLLASYGTVALSRRVLDITNLACDRLRKIGATVASHRDDESHASGIVSFEMPARDPQAVRIACSKQGVVFGCRSGRLRISAHAYNNEADVERLIAALSAAV
jgi:cysteine desulfurase/selenocysteine lyase